MKDLIDQSAISVKEVCKLLSISRATVYRRIRKDELFPKPFRLSGGRAVRWLLQDVLNYLARCAGAGVENRPANLELDVAGDSPATSRLTVLDTAGTSPAIES